MRRAAASRTARGSRSASTAESRPRVSRGRRGAITWREPLSLAHHALAVVALRLKSSVRAIEAGERFVETSRMESHRHYRNFRGLGRTLAWLQSAENRLYEADRALRRVAELSEESPEEWSQAFAAQLATTAELAQLAFQAGLLHLRFAAVSRRFSEQRKPGGTLADVDLPVAPPPLDPILLRRLRGEEGETVIQWPEAASIPVPATAFRRVSRGRAPPALLFPTL
jgi:hypothetical protein